MIGILVLGGLAVLAVGMAMAAHLHQDTAGILGDDRNSLEDP